MKQAQQARKSRPRSGSRKQSRPSGGNHRGDIKVRGNPKQLIEKYKTQARDAMQSGDRVQYEYFMQFADHYQRVLNEMRGPQDGDGDNPRRSRSERHEDRNTAEARGDSDSDAETAADDEAVEGAETPQADSNADEQRPRGRARRPRTPRGPRRTTADEVAVENEAPAAEGKDGDASEPAASEAGLQADMKDDAA